MSKSQKENKYNIINKFKIYIYIIYKKKKKNEK